MKHVEENTTVADASTYQKSGEVTSCREAATIGSEPSKKQRSEPKLKERNRLLDARQELQKEQQSDHQQRHGLGKQFLLLQHLALSRRESGDRNRWKLARRSPEHQNETEKLNALIAQRCRDRGSWWPSKIDIEWRKQMSSWMDCIIFWDWLRTFNTWVAKRPLS
jgi:hypothetical protein